MTRLEAVAKGYMVDDTVYPWVAYKGPRFAPTEAHRCMTDLESELFTHLEFCGWGDAWERKVSEALRARAQEIRRA